MGIGHVAVLSRQSNQIRGLLGKFGLIVPQGVARLRRQLPQPLEDPENGLPVLAREVPARLLAQFREPDHSRPDCRPSQPECKQDQRRQHEHVNHITMQGPDLGNERAAAHAQQYQSSEKNGSRH
jgi:hypothetical protein